MREWDEDKPILKHLHTIIGQLYRWLPILQPDGAKMWPLDPRILLYKWENGLAAPGRPLVVAYWDASPFAVGVLIRTRPDAIWKTAGMQYDRATTNVTFDDPIEAQVHRESAGAPLVLRFLRGQMYLRGWHVLFVNDCLPVVLALRMGSHSTRLQADAEEVTLCLLEAGAKGSFVHIPGTEMVASETDGASREGAQKVLGPYSTAVGREKISAFLELHCWKATIDLFATDSNKFTERYASWTDEPSNSEVVDAFSLPSWDQSTCPCSKTHRATAFIFPPRKLERAVFKRARSDWIRAIFLVPRYTANSLHGRLLLEGSAGVCNCSDGADLTKGRVSQSAGHNALFLVDFSEADSSSAVPCGQEHLRRGRRQRLSPVELEEHSRTRAELAAFDSSDGSSKRG